METVKGEDLTMELFGLGFMGVRVKDENYVIPSEDWLKQFLSWLGTAQEPYEAGRYDCDDFSEDARYWARRAYRRSVNGKQNAALPFGCVEVTNSPINRWNIGAGRHQLNIVRLSDGWYFVEPQVLKYVKVNENTLSEFSNPSLGWV